MSETMGQHPAEEKHTSGHHHKGSGAGTGVGEPAPAATVGGMQAGSGVTGETSSPAPTLLQAGDGGLVSHDLVPPTHRTL
jgi:hypothetical protein